jgi:uncharacterized membrane protein SpoIIM required for sporulation
MEARVLSRDDFVIARRPFWDELDALLGRGRLHRRPPDEISRVSLLYRAACTDLMRARSLRVGTDVTGYLDALVGRAHSALYGPKAYSLSKALQLVAADFPRTVRRHAGLFALSLLLFGVPLLVGWIGALRSEEFAFGILSRADLTQAAESYSKGFDSGREAGTNAAMAGFYVQNNIGIAFRCFATGALYGAGSVFFLVYNGLHIGTTFGFVSRSGAGANILTFACGHAPFELTAIVIAGTAGLVLGGALISPRGQTRIGSVRAASRDLGNLVLGAAAMLLIAALIEGFWSPSGVPAFVKFGFSGCAWVLVAAFLAFAGRRRAAS